MSKNVSKKPPVQKVGVPGFESFQSKKKGDDEKGINWPKLITLPSYKLFISEKFDKESFISQQDDRWSLSHTKTQIEKNGEEELFKMYCDWHHKKGHWPNETPMGELIGDE